MELEPYNEFNSGIELREINLTSFVDTGNKETQSNSYFPSSYNYQSDPQSFTRFDNEIIESIINVNDISIDEEIIDLNNLTSQMEKCSINIKKKKKKKNKNLLNKKQKRNT